MPIAPLSNAPPPRGVACLRTPERSHGWRALEPRFGAVPSALNGRLYRIGPGRFEIAGAAFNHWFDGDGLLLAVDFRDGAARAACRLIEPAGFNRPDYPLRGRFGVAPKGVLRRLRSLADPSVYVNAANTALMRWDDRLFALFEGDRPTEIDPETLATRGETDLGAIRRTFSAHPKTHRPTGALINQGFRPPPRPMLDYYALDPDGRARALGATGYGGAVLMHDFAVTDRWIVTLCPPIFLDLPGLILRGRPLSQAIRWASEAGTEILLTPIGGDPVAPTGETLRLRADPFLYSHTGAAWEEDEEIVILGVVFEDGANLDWIGSVRADAEALAPASPGRLTEIRIDPARGQVSRRAVMDRAVDFPIADPRRDGAEPGILYAAGHRDERFAYRDLFDTLLKVDLAAETARECGFGEACFVSEALFAPRPGGVAEDDGWLLSVVYDAERDQSELAILDAAAFEPVAIVPLGQALPMSFHGLWEPGQDEALERV